MADHRNAAVVAIGSFPKIVSDDDADAINRILAPVDEVQRRRAALDEIEKKAQIELELAQHILSLIAEYPGNAPSEYGAFAEQDFQLCSGALVWSVANMDAIDAAQAGVSLEDWWNMRTTDDGLTE